MTESATTRADSRRSAIITAAQRLAVDCGYAGFTVEDLARAVGVSRRTLFNHVSSKEEAVLGLLPVLTDEQAATLRSGGPTGHLVDDVLTVVLDCLHADDGTPADFEQLHDVIERNPELFVRVKTHVEELVTHLSARDDADDSRSRMALAIVGGIVQHSVVQCIATPSLGPLSDRARANLTTAREILADPA
ncbi:TetR/AcrR family transcriptional regulator [Janibacter indicus]|uniref:TetR/AcrR family transcriptional regulator n=1 Tax=Janibacter indicus TaxID=857417 RepID=A0A7L9IZI2_9MICO|nr:TetR/AcrR family transcriptional regulator [Janibacter indicus]QOK22529.1 TetR/AcrR family transcriptional regulator [Janibacter indicus]